MIYLVTHVLLSNQRSIKMKSTKKKHFKRATVSINKTDKKLLTVG